MRLEMTMSESGPSPRIHSPFSCSRSFKSTAGSPYSVPPSFRLRRLTRNPPFQLLDLIAQTRGLFVRFLGHGQPQVVSQFDQLITLLAVVGHAFGELAAVMSVAVDVFQKRKQLVAKGDVAMGAAQPPLTAKFPVRHLAGRANELFERLQLGLAECRSFDQSPRRCFGSVGILHVHLKALLAQ